MKVLKTLITLLLISCLLLSFSACNNGNNEADESSSDAFSDVSLGSESSETESVDESSENTENSENSEPETSSDESTPVAPNPPANPQTPTNPNPPVNPVTPSPNAFSGTWEYDEDITYLLKTGQAHNSEYAAIINSIDIQFFQTHRLTFDGKKMTMISYVKNARLDELLHMLSSHDLSYDDLELDRYDRREDILTMEYTVDGNKLVFDGMYMTYSLNGSYLKFLGFFNADGTPINSSDNPFNNSNFFKVTGQLVPTVPLYEKTK